MERAMAPHSNTLAWNPMDGEDWKAAVHGIAKSWTRLSDFTFTFHFHALEKEMETHSSVLAWRIPGMGELGGLPSMGSHRIGQNWSDLAAVAAAAAHSPLRTELTLFTIMSSFIETVPCSQSMVKNILMDGMLFVHDSSVPVTLHWANFPFIKKKK